MVRGSNPGGGEIFCTCPDRPWGPSNLLYNGYRVYPRCKERPGHDDDPSPPSSAVGHKRVELHLYSIYGLYSLYRVSAPVQGCTLPFYHLHLNLPNVLTLSNTKLCASSTFHICLNFPNQIHGDYSAEDVTSDVLTVVLMMIQASGL
jgi:hypothetical protein